MNLTEQVTYIAITARSESLSSDMVDLAYVFNLLMSEKERSASALVMGSVHAISRRR